MTLSDALLTLAKPVFAAADVAVGTVGLLIAAGPLAVARYRQGSDLFTDYIALVAAIDGLPLSSYVFRAATLMSSSYSMSVGASIESLEQIPSGGVACVVSMADRPWMHNPFSSVHAAALINLAEYTSGLATLSYLKRAEQKGLRGIVTEISAKYGIKARGTIRATTTIEPLSKTLTPGETHPLLVTVDLIDDKDQNVATVTVTWLLSVRKPKQVKADST